MLLFPRFYPIYHVIQLKNIYIEMERVEISYWTNRQLSPMNYSNLYH